MCDTDFFATFLADVLLPPAFTDVCKLGFGFDAEKVGVASAGGVNMQYEAGCSETGTCKVEDMSSFYEEIVIGIFEDDASGDWDDGAVDDIQMGTDWSAPPSATSILFGVGWSVGGLSPFACA